MVIPRSNGGDCQSSLSCSPSSDGQPTQPDSHSSDAANNDPVPYRYIGVAMVVGIVVLALVLWVWFGAWPKKISRRWWNRRKGRKRTDDIKATGLIDLTASLPSLEKPERVQIRDDESDIPELEPTEALAVEESGFVPGRRLGEDSIKPP